MLQTTTCCYYATLHAESTKILADVAFSKGECSRNGGKPLRGAIDGVAVLPSGQRAFIGVRITMFERCMLKFERRHSRNATWIRTIFQKTTSKKALNSP